MSFASVVLDRRAPPPLTEFRRRSSPAARMTANHDVVIAAIVRAPSVCASVIAGADYGDDGGKGVDGFGLARMGAITLRLQQMPAAGRLGPEVALVVAIRRKHVRHALGDGDAA